MNILATFDGSARSESILRQLELMAEMPGVHFTFLSIAHRPGDTTRLRRLPRPTPAEEAATSSTRMVMATPEPTLIEDRRAAVERTLAERTDYLKDLVSRMPAGSEFSVEARVADDVAAAIIRFAMEHEPDVIVMGTHGESGMIHRLFGDVAEQVVRSGVAPVLLVPANTARHAPKQ